MMFISILLVVNRCMKGKVKRQGGIYSAKAKADKSDGQILVQNSTFRSDATPKLGDDTNEIIKENSEE